MSSSGIQAVSSGPLIIRTYLDNSNNNTYLLDEYDYPVSTNRILITSTNGLLAPSDNILISSISVSSIISAAGLTISAIPLTLPLLPSITASNVVGFNSITKELSYFATPTGGGGGGVTVAKCVSVALPAYTTTGNVITFTGTGAINNLYTDDVSRSLNDVVLLLLENADSGVYTVTQLGTGSVSEQWTRQSDWNTSADFALGKQVFVTNGLCSPNFTYTMITPNVVLNTTPIIFSSIRLTNPATIETVIPDISVSGNKDLFTVPYGRQLIVQQILIFNDNDTLSTELFSVQFGNTPMSYTNRWTANNIVLNARTVGGLGGFGQPATANFPFVAIQPTQGLGCNISNNVGCPAINLRCFVQALWIQDNAS